MKTCGKFLILMPIVASLFLTSCAFQPQTPSLTPLQIEAMQTRVFHANKRQAFDSVVTVFQDLGYIINSANYNTGFITASSPAKSQHPNILALMMYMPTEVQQKTKATAFVTRRGVKRARVRLNFVYSHKTVSAINPGTSEEDKPVLNARIYQNAFNRIRQALFVQGAKTGV